MNLKDELEKANRRADPVADGLIRRAADWLIDSPYTVPIVIVAAVAVIYLVFR